LWAEANAGLTFAHTGFCTGEKFPDALAAGPFLAHDGGSLLITGPAAVPAAIAAVLAPRAPQVQTVDYIGLAGSTILQFWPYLPIGLPPSTPTLGWPSSGAAVLWLEARLSALTYRPGPIDGIYDRETYNAVIAFQKYQGLTRDGRVTADDWASLVTAKTPAAQATGTGSWVEVDKARQVLLYIEGGVVLKTLPVSTGTWSVGAPTPSGDFTVYMRWSGWRWGVYSPCFFTSYPGVGEIAIHGYDNVPTYPASHGCVRVCVWDMTELYPQLPIGARVVVY
ncbi:MAG: L,D-transpeptidase family protein, partial [Thermoleophilia bacterium]|nr:L,D-transpeptidase family protein [Thermoleophilia bacterium]